MMLPTGTPLGTLALTGDQWGFVATLLVVGLVVKAFVVWWLWSDARWRGVDPRPWVVAAVLFDLIAVAVWALARPKVSAMGPGGRSDLRARADDPRRYGIDIGTGQGRARPAFEDILDEQRARGAAPRSKGRGAGTPVTREGETIQVRCPQCAHETSVPVGPEGKTPVVCPACGRRGTV